MLQIFLNNPYTDHKFIGIIFKPRMGAVTLKRPYHLRQVKQVHKFSPFPKISPFLCGINKSQWFSSFFHGKNWLKGCSVVSPRSFPTDVSSPVFSSRFFHPDLFHTGSLPTRSFPLKVFSTPAFSTPVLSPQVFSPLSHYHPGF